MIILLKWKMTTVRTLLVVVAIQDWHTIQMNVTNTFLHGDLPETIYIKLPIGYTREKCRLQFIYDNSTVLKPTPNLVCKLN